MTVAGSLIVLFQNCARPYELSVTPYDFRSLKSEELEVNQGRGTTNDGRLQISIPIASGVATEAYLTNALSCGAGGVWQSFTQPLNFFLQGEDGVQKLYLKLRKANGEESPCYDVNVTLDRQPPSISLSIKPDLLTGNPDVEFALKVDDAVSGVANIECNLNGGEFSACERKFTLRGLRPGNYIMRARAIDRAGNISRTLRFDWAVDRTKPVINVASSVQSDVVSATEATFAFTAIDSATGATLTEFICQLDSATPAPCRSPVRLTGLSAGKHTFNVHAVSKDKRESGKWRQTWTIDSELD